MFREMRRKNQALTKEECIRILKEEPRGVMALAGDGGYPYAVPLNFVFNEETGKIYFHGAKTGHKIDAIRNCNKASFCVYDKGFKKPGEWAYNVSSVILFGKIDIIEDVEEVKVKIRELCEKFYPDMNEAEEEIRKYAKNASLLVFNIEHMSGKIIKES